MGGQEPDRSKAKAYPPGMDERSLGIQRRLEFPMALAALLTVPMVAISESHPGGALEATAHLLNWATWLAFLFELLVMLAVVPDRGAWLRHHPLDLLTGQTIDTTQLSLPKSINFDSVKISLDRNRFSHYASLRCKDAPKEAKQ